MMAEGSPRARLLRIAARRKHVLPAPLESRIRILPCESRKRDTGPTERDIGIEHGPYVEELHLEQSRGRFGKHGNAIFSPLSVPHDDLPEFRIDIFHSEG